jgi:hypothetical protein
MNMSIEIEVAQKVYSVDGSRALTEQEFNVLAEYVRQYRTDQDSREVKRNRLKVLESKLLDPAITSSHLEESDFETLADLVECEISIELAKIDKIQDKIDEIWRVAPEIVTGGGYALHIERWNADV